MWEGSASTSGLKGKPAKETKLVNQKEWTKGGTECETRGVKESLKTHRRGERPRSTEEEEGKRSAEAKKPWAGRPLTQRKCTRKDPAGCSTYIIKKTQRMVNRREE